MGCSAPQVFVGTVNGNPFYLPSSDFERAQPLLSNVSGDSGDPTYDAYEENIALGNNTKSTSTNLATGTQVPSIPDTQPPKQTTLPTPSPIPPIQVINTPGKGGNGTPVTCTIWDGTNYDTPLSANFTLKQFSVQAYFPHPVIAYQSMTAQQRFCNLQNLASNVAEALFAKFGPFRINSGIRNSSSIASGLSQHETGQAMDVQFPSWSYDKYWENAAWIKDNINYDQFIFEHSTVGAAWLHLSYNLAGNRATTNRTKVMTMFRNHYDTGLQKHG